MKVREKIRRLIRYGLDDLDDAIRSLIERFSRGELELDAYLELRAGLEREKEKRVLENLRRMR